MTIAQIFRQLLAVAAETRRRLLLPPTEGPGNWWSYLDQTTNTMEVAEGEIANILANAQITGYAEETARVFREATGQAVPALKIMENPDRAVQLVGPFEGAAKLRGLTAHLPETFNLIKGDARRLAFSVARTTSIQTVEAVRDIVADATEKGLQFRQVRPQLAEALKTTPLSVPQQKTIFRTYVGRAQAAGMLETLDHPVVRDEFPYFQYHATLDSRVRIEHKAFEVHVDEFEGSPWGLDGTNVYRSDDPVWDAFFPPWSWNCRCMVIPIPREAAAQAGVKEAIRWVETGMKPANPQYVKCPPYSPPKNWVPTGRRLLAA